MVDHRTDDREEMACGGSDVARIIGIVAPQRPFALRIDALRAGDDPPERKPGRIVGQGADAVPELVRLLREEAKVL